MLENELDIKKAQKGDHEAFTRLFRQLESQLYRLAKTILLKDEDCADALQETTLKVYKGLANLKQPKFFKTWVIRILINECNQLLRMRERTIAVAEIPEEPVVSYVHFEDSGNVDLQSFINQLDESLRLAIVLFYYDDLSIKQIADVLDISEGAVRARLHRARRLLSKQIHPVPEEGLANE
ncbi:MULTISPECIES: sigma-70 family RNA polymerase sigma factor [Paenibacillus]|uniref:sigma-70 family RNA polymerase sigma factor n=1 Tax=Paenibacillus TaxID=44249 RepID=UPI0003E22C92|nr:MULTISPECIES: sigma-70 family RNA polymerase sigma factor [Paenibacillus]ETT59650.1 RNA polymerase sigma-H factor Sigma-30 [Paenibacillus sp. FSL H8-237]MEC0131732.1 sigma-70 family RNA polymerase sigma factor [Paenibacillus odorifer]MEC0220032.1 sigma-70 family RNA polymerase sigma factor [Paenibacillus odorifer]